MEQHGGVIGGRYQLLHRLGSGGMAEVWLATDLRLDGKQVAVKRLLGFSAGNPDSASDVERARREAFAASRLNHPNLVGVTDFVAEDGEPFIVMEYVEGSTLAELIPPDGLPAQRAAHLLAQVAAALVEAHEAQIVHRDIKPANILITRRDVAKLADFGIARRADDPRLTRTGFFTGTVAYLAPEVLEGADASSASDVWALGAVLFETIEGRPAFDGPTTASIIAAIVVKDPPRSSRSPRLAALIAGMLQRDPAARTPVESVAGQLGEIAADRPAPGVATPRDARSTVSARLPPQPPLPPRGTGGPPRPGGPSPSAPPARRRSGRGWLIALVAAVVVALGVGIPLLLVSGGGNSGTKQPVTPRTHGPSGTGTSTSGTSGTAGTSGSSSSGSSTGGGTTTVASTFTVLAHQGGDEYFPEETVPAFRQAARAGYAVELDVRWTSDGVAVISHDDQTAADVRCDGGPRLISRTTAAALRADCHTAASAATDGRTYSVPTFDEAAQALSPIPGATMFAEVKVVQTPAEIASYLSTLRSNDMLARTVVTSFIAPELGKMRAAAKDSSLRLMRFVSRSQVALPTLRAEHLWAVAVDSRVSTGSYLAALHAAGLRTIVFTVNTDAQWAAARQQGADYVLTDRPRAYLAWRHSH